MNRKKILTILIMISTTVIPLIFSFKIVNYYDLPKTLALYFISSLLILFYHFPSYNNEKNSGLLTRFMIFYILWFLCITIFSQNPMINILGLHGRFQSLLFFIFSMTFFFLGQKVKEYRFGIIKVIILTGIIVSLLTIREFWNGSNRCGSTLGNPVFLANYLLLIIPLVISFIFSSENNWLRWGYGIGLMVLLISLFFTFSRAGWIGLFIIIIIFGINHWKQIKNKKLLLGVIFLTICISTIVCISMIQHQPSQTVKKNPARLQQMQEHPMVDEPRILMIGAAWKAFLNHPFTGIGINSYAYQITKYLPLKLVAQNPEQMWDQTHNDFFQSLATQGIGGSLFYIVFIGILFYKWNHWRRSKSKDWLTAGIWAAIFGHLLLLQFSFPWVGYSFLFWFLVGLVNEEKTFKVKKVDNLQRFKFTISVVLTILIIGYIGRYWSAERHFFNGLKKIEHKQYLEAESEIQKSIKLFPWELQYRFNRARNLLSILQLKTLSTDIRSAYNLKLSHEIAYLITHNPNNFKYRILAGDAFYLYGKLEETREYYLQALELYPFYYPLMIRLANLEVELEKYQEARFHYQEVLKVKPDNHAAIEGLKRLTDIIK